MVWWGILRDVRSLEPLGYVLAFLVTFSMEGSVFVLIVRDVFGDFRVFGVFGIFGVFATFVVGGFFNILFNFNMKN